MIDLHEERASKCLLIATIDDGTSDISGAGFFESETTWGCFNILEDVILNRAIPEGVLTGQAGWSTGGTKRESFSQFARACDELNIKLIGTPSAESKGRIERLNRTPLQSSTRSPNSGNGNLWN